VATATLRLGFVHPWAKMNKISLFQYSQNKHNNKICCLLGYYAASCGNCWPTFRDNVSVPSSRVKKSKSVQNSHSTLCNIPEELISHVQPRFTNISYLACHGGIAIARLSRSYRDCIGLNIIYAVDKMPQRNATRLNFRYTNFVWWKLAPNAVMVM
jgi:hypothetical protein